ncbi:MAG: sulfatase [Alphaproteobacteria bacterium]|nr:sulfatase [Alphaproteobacteria bacterium]
MDTLKYYLKRIAPFYALFLSISALLRIVLLAKEQANLDALWTEAALALPIGLLLDTATFAYFMLPLALYPLILPKRKYGSRFDRFFSTGLFFLLSFTVLFTALGEWFFWDEFASRFNFISVDYLVYTNEVIGNIRESYPVVPLVSLVIFLSAVLSWIFHSRQPQPTAQPSGTARMMMFAGVVAFAVASFLLVDSSRLSAISPNRYITEIAKNGTYELFSAYRHNELPFHQFYTTEDAHTLISNLRKQVGVAGTEQGMLTRRITATGAEKDYNVVLITVESLSANYMAAFGNKQGLTPNLDKLADESLFFTNLYATGTRTVYGLSAITLSIPPIPGNSIVRRPENEKLFSLASVLDSKGYDSKFIYGGYGYFDNMNYFFGNNGYKVVDRTNIPTDDTQFGNVWGIADEYLFTQVLKENDDAYKTGKPLFDMVMTTSNHRPFTYPEGRIDIPSGKGRFGGVKYTDYAIGKFLAEAKTKPWFDHTIFVIVADHTAGSAGKTELNPEGYHIPMLVYAPGIIAPQKVEKLVSQIDVAPTILGLLNMSYESRFYGQDALRDDAKERAFISNYLQLGYLSPDELVVFKPVKAIEHYSKVDDRFVKDDAPSGDFATEGLTYFQSASYWKSWSRDIDRPTMISKSE